MAYPAEQPLIVMGETTPLQHSSMKRCALPLHEP
jgi:hypothetical protein